MGKTFGGKYVNNVSFCTDTYKFPGSREYSERVLACLLWALVMADESYLMGTRDEVPLLYQSGVYWKAEEPLGVSVCPEGVGQELFLGIRQIRNQGFADCEDVACWRVSELRLGHAGPETRGLPPFPGHPPVTAIRAPFPLRARGVDAMPAFFSRKTGPNTTTIHIVVAWPDGYVEDPSRVLGMGGARRYG